ncbi:MAG: thioredoxin [Bacilli bacterium]|nr:thioredoxin [Bacilli bacterium]
MMVIEGNKEIFEKEVLNGEGKVLVDFNATWCGPCKMLKPVLDQVAKDGKKIVAIDVDDDRDLAIEYGINSIPCLILFENGKEVKRSVGLVPINEIESLFED